MTLIYEQAWEQAALLVSAWHGVPVSPEWLAQTCHPLLTLKAEAEQTQSKEQYGCLLPACGSDNSLLIWLKLRLNAAGSFAVPRCVPPQISLPVPLHIGFLCLEETPAMLALLQRELTEPVPA